VLSLSLGMLEEGEEGESGSDSVSEDEESVGVGGWRASLGARPYLQDGFHSGSRPPIATAIVRDATAHRPLVRLVLLGEPVVLGGLLVEGELRLPGEPWKRQVVVVQ
jgi:hypothetical protein